MKKLLLSAAVVAMSAASAFAMEAPSQLYLIGAYEGGGWDPEVGLAMDEYEDGVFYVEDVYMNEGTSYFAFTSQLGSWDDVNAGRVAPTEKDAEFLVDEGNAFVYGVDASWAIPEGTYDFYVNFNTGVAATTYEATLDEVVTPEPGPGPAVTDIYVIGEDVNGNSWTLAASDALMTYNENNGTYVWYGEYLGAGFKFNNGTWSNDNLNFGAASDDDNELTLGVPFELTTGGGSKNIIFANDLEGVEEPVVVFNLEAKTVVVDYAAGVSTISNDLKGADVIYNLNGVRVNSNNLTPGIYIINGKKVAIK